MNLSTDDVWRLMARQAFMVVGMVNTRGQGRTAGVVPAVQDRAVWFAASSHDWKVRHLLHQPDVSATVPVRRGGVLALVAPLPPATITFQAAAHVVRPESAPEPVRRRLARGLSEPSPTRGEVVLVRLDPHGQFVTYGVGVSLTAMTDTERARGRAPVSGSTS